MRSAFVVCSVLLCGLAASASASACPPATGTPLSLPLGAPSLASTTAESGVAMAPIVWRRSVALGHPNRGRLANGVQLPAEGPTWFTWDWALDTAPNRDWRRWGTDRLLRAIFAVLDEYAVAHPDGPRVGIADLSRPQGGRFGREFGGLGHASHQNGLDVDVLYPRKDCLERPPLRPAQIDRPLAQELIDAFVEAGARYAFVGPHTGLRGPRRVVKTLAHHDDHVHVRIRAR